MNPENILAGTASLFLALGDATRLRLLNLMKDQEICVSSFTGALGQSQPLVSRHLAYLRNSGLVEARRDGKWMHYSISTTFDANTTRLLVELFRWMDAQEGLQLDRERYFEAHPAAVSAKTASSATAGSTPNQKHKRTRETWSDSLPNTRPKPDLLTEPATESTTGDDFALSAEAEFEQEAFEASSPRHNELEDFLL